MKNITIKGNRGKGLNIKLFEWNMTERCQLRCSYCYYTQNNLSGKNGYIDKNWNKIMTEINENQQKSSLKYKVEFFGGECLMHPNLIDILKICDINYILFTNLQWNFKYVEKFINEKCERIYTSIHFEYDNKKVIDNIKMLLDKGKYVSCNVMLENIKTEDEILEMYFKLKEMGCNRVTLRILDFRDKEKIVKYYKNMDMNKFTNYIDDSLKYYVNGNEKNEIVEFKNPSLKYKTKSVLCDIGRYFTVIKWGKYYNCCGKIKNEGDENSFENYNIDFFENNIYCKNEICNRCDLRYGSKVGVFL